MNNGIMRTTNFRMNGPAAEVFMSGETNIINETQDLNVKVTPHISDSLSIAALAGGEMPAAPMGTEPGVAPEMPAEEPMVPAQPDEMNAEPADEFAAADAAAGAGTTGREIRESKFVKKLAESHSIISRLAR